MINNRINNLDIYKAYIKSPYKSIKHSTYFDSYSSFFSKYRNKKITFVEIGILDGGSLFMWRDYFGSKARIIGVDFNEECIKWEKFGFEIFIGDQSDDNFWRDFKKKIGSIDVVLDDGGHTYEQQIKTVENLIGVINNNGIIVIEDTHTSYMRGFGPRKYSFIEYVKIQIDKINHRFSKLNDLNAEKRIWSIEIVESMVAFKVNKEASYLNSFSTDNGGNGSLVKDARYKNLKTIGLLYYLKNKLFFINKIPFRKSIILFIKDLIIKINFKAKKYFK